MQQYLHLLTWPTYNKWAGRHSATELRLLTRSTRRALRVWHWTRAYINVWCQEYKIQNTMAFWYLRCPSPTQITGLQLTWSSLIIQSSTCLQLLMWNHLTVSHGRNYTHLIKIQHHISRQVHWVCTIPTAIWLLTVCSNCHVWQTMKAVCSL